MKTWIKAGVIACIVEIPLLAVFIATRHRQNWAMLTHDCLGWYHVLAIWFAQYFLVIWNPGPRPGPTFSSNIVAWVVVFFSQVAITSPFIYGFLKCAEQAMRKTMYLD